MSISKCCKASVTVMGGKTRGCTNWYECGKCGEACDVMAKSKRKKREWMAWMVLSSFGTFSVYQLEKHAHQCAETCGDGFNIIKVKITEVR